MLDSKRLMVFCAVAESGSFTAAASRLNLTQSAVSQQIATLESDVGTPLMKRVPRGIELTPEGEFLLDRARGVLRDLTRLEQELRRLTKSPDKVNLGIFATAGAHLVPALVAEYRRRHPERQLVLHASQPETIGDALAAGEIDVGITWDYDYLPRPAGQLYRQHLLTDPLWLLLPRDHPLAEKDGPFRLIDFADERWIVRQHRSPSYEDVFEVMCRLAGFEPVIAFRAEDYQSVQGFVAAHVGIAVAPKLSLSAVRADVVVKELRDPMFARRIDAVALTNFASNPLVRELLEVLTNVAEQKRIE